MHIDKIKFHLLVKDNWEKPAEIPPEIVIHQPPTNLFVQVFLKKRNIHLPVE